MCVRGRKKRRCGLRVRGIKNKRVREKERGGGGRVVDSQQRQKPTMLFFFYVPLYFVVVSLAFRAVQ